jgi:hypothetical protein
MFSKKSGKRKLIESTLVCRFVSFSKYIQYDTILDIKIKSLVLAKVDLAYLQLAGVTLPKYASVENFTEHFLHNHSRRTGNCVEIIIRLGVEDLVDAPRSGGGDILKINNELLSNKGKFYAKDL